MPGEVRLRFPRDGAVQPGGVAGPAGAVQGRHHPAGRLVDGEGGGVVHLAGGVLHGARVVPAVLQTQLGDGDGAAEAVHAPDESVRGLLQGLQTGVSPPECERQVALRRLAGDPGPAGQGQVRPELEGDDLRGDPPTSPPTS